MLIRCAHVLRISLLMITFDFSVSQEDVAIPYTRYKGQIACYSCLGLNGPGLSSDSELPQDLGNLTEIAQLLEEGGMNVPAAVEHCADTAPTANPNFHGVQVHICPNTPDRPGACVKFKGHYKGEYFVYRECWSHMWRDPRPYYHRMSGICFDDEMVQNFVGSSDNTICFCEDDLCNSALSLSPALALLLMMLVAGALLTA